MRIRPAVWVSSAVFLTLAGMPGRLAAQDPPRCSFCAPCPYDPDLRYLNDYHLTQFYVYWFAMHGCGDFWCDELSQCDPHEDKEDQEVLKELTSLVEAGAGGELGALVLGHREAFTYAPERGVLIFRHGCDDSIVTVFPLTRDQVRALQPTFERGEPQPDLPGYEGLTGDNRSTTRGSG